MAATMTITMRVRVRRLWPARLWLRLAAWSVGRFGRPRAPLVARVGNVLLGLARVQTRPDGARRWHSQPFPGRLDATGDGYLAER